MNIKNRSMIGILILMNAIGFSVNAFCQSPIPANEMYNKDLHYTFDAGKLLINISSDTTVYWRDDSKPKEAHEKSKSVHLDQYRVITAWFESDKTFVSMHSDFEKWLVTCMIAWPDGRFYSIKGKIDLAENKK